MRRLGSLLLTAAAVAGSMCLVVALAGVLFGVKPLVFRSGSMGPDIPAGALGLAHPVDARDLRVGDVVSVRRSSGELVTHRVAGIAGRGGDRAELTLRGDANPAVDTETYVVSSADRLFFSVPWGGQVVVFLGSVPGLLLLGATCAGLLVFAFRPTPRPRPGGRRKAVRAAVVPVAVAVAASTSTGTTASFSDTATVNGAAMTSYTVPAPTLSCGALGVLSVTFTWSAVADATDYVLTAGGTDYVVTGTSKTVVAVITGGTATVVARRNFGQTTWRSVASNSRSYTVAAVSLCS